MPSKQQKQPEEHEVAKRVRAARSYAGLTQEDMAHRLDMAGVTYKRIERGLREVSLPELHRVAEITGWPVEMFHVPFDSVAGASQAEQLELLQSELQDLVTRLQDLEWRTRQNVEKAS